MKNKFINWESKLNLKKNITLNKKFTYYFINYNGIDFYGKELDANIWFYVNKKNIITM